MADQVEHTSYVNFDTDGGNNCGPCYDAIRELMTKLGPFAKGQVLGVGSWVDQDCATKVAKLLRGKCVLALNFPEHNAADLLLREDLSRWIGVLRSSPVSLTIAAGSTGWTARQGLRSENGVDCIFARPLGDGDNDLTFGAPDVTDIDFTKAQLSGLNAGDSVELYLLSRFQVHELAAKLFVVPSGVDTSTAKTCSVNIQPESLNGVALAHHWLSALASACPSGLACNTSVLCTRLRQRLEDDLSFAWNLPTKSGSTAAVGRAKTQLRPSVSTDKQPLEPILKSLSRPAPLPMPSFSFPPAPRTACFGGGAGRAFPQARSNSPRIATRMIRTMRGSNGSSSGFRSQESNETQSGALGPLMLLKASDFMRAGPQGTVGITSQDAAKRSFAALKHVAQGLLPATSPAETPFSKEDPLVSALFGSAPATPGSAQFIHWNFVCDGCGAARITGTRYKAVNKVDHDVCFNCRANGRFAAGEGFVPIADATTALRASLVALFEWWPLWTLSSTGGTATPVFPSSVVQLLSQPGGLANMQHVGKDVLLLMIEQLSAL